MLFLVHSQAGNIKEVWKQLAGVPRPGRSDVLEHGTEIGTWV